MIWNIKSIGYANINRIQDKKELEFNQIDGIAYTHNRKKITPSKATVAKGEKAKCTISTIIWFKKLIIRSNSGTDTRAKKIIEWRQKCQAQI